MANKLKTHIFCFDDHRGFSDDVKKRFADSSRYVVYSFQTREDFIDQIETEKESKFCKIAILGVHENIEQFEMVDTLTAEVKKIDQHTGLILLVPPEKIEDIKKAIRFNIDAYIPKNSNSILRIHNIVKKLISEHNIYIFKKRRNLSLYLLVSFVLIAIIAILIAYFRMPEYF